MSENTVIVSIFAISKNDSSNIFLKSKSLLNILPVAKITETTENYKGNSNNFYSNASFIRNPVINPFLFCIVWPLDQNILGVLNSSLTATVCEKKEFGNNNYYNNGS